MRYTLLFVFFSLSQGSIAQAIVTSTTETEYLWCINLFKNVELGGDIKNGYTIVDLGEKITADNSYEFTFKMFIRDGIEAQKKEPEVACIIVVAKSTTWSNKYYLCLPFNNVELSTRYNQSINAWDKGMSNAYAKVLSAYFGQIFSTLMQCEAKK